MTQLDDRATTPTDEARGPSRRQVLLTSGVVAAAAAVTAACGSSSASTSSPATTTPAASSPAASTPPASGPAASTPAASGIQVSTADVPVGGGTILADQKVVVTQPVAGTYKAFTAVCTHQGCTVASVANGTITCPCHGSTFSAADGSVTGGPPPAPLTRLPVKVERGRVVVGFAV